MSDWITPLLLSIGTLACMVAILWKGKPAPAPARACEHSRVPIAAQTVMGTCVFTLLLVRCSKCGHHNTESYPGDWKMADFLRERSDVSDLEAMYNK